MSERVLPSNQGVGNTPNPPVMPRHPPSSPLGTRGPEVERDEFTKLVDHFKGLINSPDPEDSDEEEISELTEKIWQLGLEGELTSDQVKLVDEIGGSCFMAYFKKSGGDEVALNVLSLASRSPSFKKEVEGKNLESVLETTLPLSDEYKSESELM